MCPYMELMVVKSWITQVRASSVYSVFCLFLPLLSSVLVLLFTHTFIIAVDALEVLIFCDVGEEPSVKSNASCKTVIHYSPFYLSY